VDKPYEVLSFMRGWAVLFCLLWGYREISISTQEIRYDAVCRITKQWSKLE